MGDPDIDIVVELIGGLEPARAFQLAALAAGKSVVTANKQLLSQHGAELLRAAEDAGVFLRFEASSVGAVPVIKVLRESLAAAEVTGVMGIVNGTTNYILSAMTDTGAEYGPTLKKAQELGFAEADPTEDVTGKDAAAKMAILSSIAFHSRVRLGDVEHEGIEGLADADVAHGKALGLVPKLLGVAKLIDGRVNVRVYPCFIPAGHPLAGVSGAYNAVFLESDSFDKIMLFGPGAGGTPTASAVIGDIISIVNTAPGGYVRNCVCYKDLAFFPKDEVVSRFYLRLHVVDQPGRAGAARQALRRRGCEHAARCSRPARARPPSLCSCCIPCARRASSSPSSRSRRSRWCAARRASCGWRASMPADATPGRGAGGGASYEAWGKTGVPGRGVIAHYRRWLPVTERTPVVTLGEGDTPLVAARHLGEELGVELYLKFEGLNPTGSFKDRGMTMAISKAVEEGARPSSAPRPATPARRPRPTRRGPA